MPHRLVPALLVLLGGCAAPAPSASGDLPVGSWSGTFATEGAVGSVPATLYVEPNQVEFVVGAARVPSDEASYEDGRLRFRAPQFPVSRIQHRLLRCDLREERGVYRGTCQAGTARYQLLLTPR